jgi:hypothetical protein
MPTHNQTFKPIQKTMAAVITPSLRAALERLKHAGAINGLALSWRRDLLLNLMPFEAFRVEKVLDVLDTGRDHFKGSEREVDTLWFGLDEVFLLSVQFKECQLLVLHTRADEVDFIRAAAMTLLEDSQLLIASILKPGDSEVSGAVTEKLKNPED